jgi:NADPH:quinone reductase-like Zn-dependent oxidoreductase
VLIYGGASGIGTIAIQCAKLWGTNVYATASTPQKTALCQRLGATPILYTQENLVDYVTHSTGGKGVDVILDMVGGKNATTNMRLAANGGRIITIALQMGSKAEMGFGALLTKQLLWKGALLRRHALSQKIAFAEAVQQHFWPSVEKNVIFPVIDSVFALEDASIALEKMRRREHLGKMVLRCSS